MSLSWGTNNMYQSASWWRFYQNSTSLSLYVSPKQLFEWFPLLSFVRWCVHLIMLDYHWVLFVVWRMRPSNDVWEWAFSIVHYLMTGWEGRSVRVDVIDMVVCSPTGVRLQPSWLRKVLKRLLKRSCWRWAFRSDIAMCDLWGRLMGCKSERAVNYFLWLYVWIQSQFFVMILINFGFILCWINEIVLKIILCLKSLKENTSLVTVKRTTETALIRHNIRDCLKPLTFHIFRRL